MPGEQGQEQSHLLAHIHVGNATELFEQVARKKGNDVVLGRDNLVRAVDMVFLWSSFVVEVGAREGLIEVYGTGSVRSAPDEERLEGKVAELVPPSSPPRWLGCGHEA